jgi:hypothetical protein
MSTLWASFKRHGILQWDKILDDGSLRWGTTFQGSRSEGTLLTSLSHTRQPVRGARAECCSDSLDAVTYLAGNTLESLSTFRNAMCESYEVSEVFLGSAEEGTNVTVLLILWDNLV